MGYFGIDIGSYSVKFVKADGEGGSAKIKKFGSVYNPVGQILPSDKGKFRQLAGAIKKGLKENGLLGQNCHLSLPGPQAYVSIISMPILNDAELASAIRWEAEQHIPVNMSEVNFEYGLVWRPDKDSSEDEMLVFLVGAPKKTVDRYLELLELVGIEPTGLEPEVLSLARAFFSGKRQGEMVTTLVCNFGALSTSFAVVDDQYRIVVAHSAPIGSLALTRALEKGLSLAPSQAEEYKRTYGLDSSKLEGKVRVVLLPVFDALVRELRKTIQFYVSKDPGMNKVQRLVVAGGGANLPGMAAYLAEVLSMEVVVGDLFKSFGVRHKDKLPAERASYSVALGLATKEF